MNDNQTHTLYRLKIPFSGELTVTCKLIQITKIHPFIGIS